MSKKDLSSYKIVLINFYFGTLPAYFPFFLKSCSYNPQITWWIFTDQKKTGKWPDNVVWHPMTFESCRDLFQAKFSYPISLDTPKKLCDYKPLYGYILKENLTDFDFWGCCDLDVIYGRIHIEEQILGGYDKLFTLGHFTLYRNTPECSEYLLNFDEGARVKEVLETPYMIAFDEWGKGNVNEIYLHSGIPFYREAFGADIWPANDIFRYSRFRPQDDRYEPVAGTEGILRWKNGVLTYIYRDGREENVCYAHLQKRRFKIDCSFDADEFYIIPGAFRDADTDSEKLLRHAFKKHMIDRQWIRIKKINFRNRMKKLLRKTGR